jgi:hypothetical protein
MVRESSNATIQEKIRYSLRHTADAAPSGINLVRSFSRKPFHGIKGVIDIIPQYFTFPMKLLKSAAVYIA